LGYGPGTRREQRAAAMRLVGARPRQIALIAAVESTVAAAAGVAAGFGLFGYGYDLLAEATRLLVAEGADRIVAATDVTNLPMAATFAKAGYPRRPAPHRLRLMTGFMIVEQIPQHEWFLLHDHDGAVDHCWHECDGLPGMRPRRRAAAFTRGDFV
jgi:hypothetical protein